MLSGTQYTPIGGLQGDFSALISKAGSEAEVIREYHGQNWAGSDPWAAGPARLSSGSQGPSFPTGERTHRAEEEMSLSCWWLLSGVVSQVYTLVLEGYWVLCFKDPSQD